MEADQNLFPFNIWKQSCLKSYAAIDEELKQHPRIDSFYSGTTALTVVKQVINYTKFWFLYVSVQDQDGWDGVHID